MLQRRRALDLANDVLGQDLAQLHTPLIEGVDLPDGSLRKNRVLVERHQLAQRFRRQTLCQKNV